MPTYDYTRDGNGSINNEFFRSSVLIKVELKVSDIIASDSTLTTNGVIAANDIIQMIDIPVGFVFTNFYVKTITAEGAALTADFGLAGGAEIAAAYSLNLTAGTITPMLVDPGWGADTIMGYAFSAVDTIDMQFLAETDAGEWHAYIAGWFLR